MDMTSIFPGPSENQTINNIHMTSGTFNDTQASKYNGIWFMLGNTTSSGYKAQQIGQTFLNYLFIYWNPMKMYKN